MQFIRLLRGMGIALAIALPTLSFAQTPITYSQGDGAIFSVSMPDFWLARSGGPRVFEDPDFGEFEVRRIIALQPETNEDAWIGLSSP